MSPAADTLRYRRRAASTPTCRCRANTPCTNRVGANATIVCGHALGEYALVGAGSVVTKDVPAHALVVGNPARITALVCACGEVVARATDGQLPNGPHTCACGRTVTAS